LTTLTEPERKCSCRTYVIPLTVPPPLRLEVPARETSQRLRGASKRRSGDDDMHRHIRWTFAAVKRCWTRALGFPGRHRVHIYEASSPEAIAGPKLADLPVDEQSSPSRQTRRRPLPDPVAAN